MNNKTLTKWVRIGRTGTYTYSNGQKHTFTEADLDALQAGYDPKKQEAALCFGHPKDSDPAFGWVESLKRDGGELFARFARVPAQVQKLVDDGFYRHVSMSISPDKKRLLHVGLLGAAAPAIEGLGPVAFKEAEGITINFSAPEQAAEANGGSMNLEELQKQIIALQQEIATLRAENEKLKGDNGEIEKGKAEAEKQAADVAAEFAAYKSKLTTTKREERVAALVKSGKLEPAKIQDTISFAAALAKVEEPVNFSAADGKIEVITAEERYFRDIEASQPSPLSLNFSATAPAPAHAAQTTQAHNPADITSKL